MTPMTERIRAYIEVLPAGEPFSSKAFLTFGTRAAVDQALARLARAGAIARATRGVYVKPIQNPFVGPVLPGPEKIVEAIAQATGATVGVHGAEAARRLELSTQVPMRTVFYTTGPSRTFHLGKLKVKLQHTTPRKLALAGRPAGLALVALWHLGKTNVSPEVIESVRRKLSPAEFEALKAAAPSMPGWLADAFVRHTREQLHG